VISRRRSFIEPTLPPGIEVEFFLSEKRTVQLCLDCAEGKNVDFTDRNSRRVPCSFVVHCSWSNKYSREVAEDISEGGIFLRTDNLLPVGTEMVCRLKPSGFWFGMKILGKVAWLQENELSKGMGVSFTFKGKRKRKRMGELVKQLASSQDLVLSGKTRGT